jgi:hypothetical protein
MTGKGAAEWLFSGHNRQNHWLKTIWQLGSGPQVRWLESRPRPLLGSRFGATRRRIRGELLRVGFDGSHPTLAAVTEQILDEDASGSISVADFETKRCRQYDFVTWHVASRLPPPIACRVPLQERQAIREPQCLVALPRPRRRRHATCTRRRPASGGRSHGRR